MEAKRGLEKHLMSKGLFPPGRSCRNAAEAQPAFIPCPLAAEPIALRKKAQQSPFKR